MASCSLCSRRVRPSSSCGCGSPMHRCAPAAAPRRATHCCACLWGSRRRAHARTHASPLRCAGCQPEPGHRPRHGHEGPHPHQLERSGAAARHRQRQGRPGHLQQAAAQEAAHPRQAHQEDHLRRVEQREQASARLRGPAGDPRPAHTAIPRTRPPPPPAASRTRPPRRRACARGGTQAQRRARLPACGLCRGLCLTVRAPCPVADHYQQPRRRYAAPEHAQADPGRCAVRRAEGRRGPRRRRQGHDHVRGARREVAAALRCERPRPHAGGAGLPAQVWQPGHVPLVRRRLHRARLRERLPRRHVFQPAADQRGALLTAAARGPPLRTRALAPAAARRHLQRQHHQGRRLRRRVPRATRGVRRPRLRPGPARADGVDGRRPDPHGVEQLGLRLQLPRLPARAGRGARHALHLPHLAPRAQRLLGAARWQPRAPRHTHLHGAHLRRAGAGARGARHEQPRLLP